MVTLYLCSTLLTAETLFLPLCIQAIEMLAAAATSRVCRHDEMPSGLMLIANRLICVVFL